MKRLMSGALLLGAVVVAASCNNVTGDLAGGPTRITVDHNPLALKKHTRANVVVQNYDDQGSPLLSNASVVGTPNANVTVEVDTAFQQHGVHYGTQFIVTGNEFGTAFVTFTDAGLTAGEDTILVIPTDTNALATISNTNPAIGDTVTITLTEPTFRFSDSSEVTVDSTKIELVSISADSQTITFIAPDTLITKVNDDNSIDTLGSAHHDGPINVTNTQIRYFAGSAATRLLGAFQVQSTTNMVIP